MAEETIKIGSVVALTGTPAISMTVVAMGAQTIKAIYFSQTEWLFKSVDYPKDCFKLYSQK